jgi:hypothetical protein
VRDRSVISVTSPTPRSYSQRRIWSARNGRSPPAVQLDGRDETRTSGRRLDYLFATPALAAGARGEVYDTFDEGLDGGLPKAGDFPEIGILEAADHFPVFADFLLGAGDGAVPPTPGNVVLTEVMADPSACDDAVGEWVEVHNPTEDPVDLAGLVLGDRQGQATVAGVGVLAPGRHAVLAREGGICGLHVAGTFTAQLANGGDDVTLRTAGGVRLDGFAWDATTSGRSWQRDGDRWCLGADGGTPGGGQRGLPLTPVLARNTVAGSIIRALARRTARSACAPGRRRAPRPPAAARGGDHVARRPSRQLPVAPVRGRTSIHTPPFARVVPRRPCATRGFAGRTRS